MFHSVINNVKAFGKIEKAEKFLGAGGGEDVSQIGTVASVFSVEWPGRKETVMG